MIRTFIHKKNSLYTIIFTNYFRKLQEKFQSNKPFSQNKIRHSFLGKLYALAPYKVNCFTWLLAKEAVLTRENLNNKGYQLCSRNFFLWGAAETINHLFLNCKWTDQLWRMFIVLELIRCVKPGSITGELKCRKMDGNATKGRGEMEDYPGMYLEVSLERNETRDALRMCITVCRISKCNV